MADPWAKPYMSILLVRRKVYFCYYSYKLDTPVMPNRYQMQFCDVGATALFADVISKRVASPKRHVCLVRNLASLSSASNKPSNENNEAIHITCGSATTRRKVSRYLVSLVFTSQIANPASAARMTSITEESSETIRDEEITHYTIVTPCCSANR
jgi:hypothetical protein